MTQGRARGGQRIATSLLSAQKHEGFFLSFSNAELDISRFGYKAGDEVNLEGLVHLSSAQPIDRVETLVETLNRLYRGPISVQFDGVEV